MDQIEWQDDSSSCVEMACAAPCLVANWSKWAFWVHREEKGRAGGGARDASLVKELEKKERTRRDEQGENTKKARASKRARTSSEQKTRIQIKTTKRSTLLLLPLQKRNGFVDGGGRVRLRLADSSLPGLCGLRRHPGSGLFDRPLAAARPRVLRLQSVRERSIVVGLVFVDSFAALLRCFCLRPAALRRPPLLHAPVLDQGQKGAFRLM